MLIETVQESEMFWLNATNIALGLVVLVCAIVLAGAVLKAVLERSKALKEIDHDMRNLADSHAFEVPGLGLTMADGGEPVQKPHRKGR